MKLILILILFVSPLVAFSQTTTAEIEKAYFEVNVNGESAFYTDLHCNSEPFSKSQFRSLEQTAMEKEGVFDLQFLENGKVIRIAHLSFVEPETLKSFGLLMCDQIEVNQRQPYSF